MSPLLSSSDPLALIDYDTYDADIFAFSGSSKHHSFTEDMSTDGPKMGRVRVHVNVCFFMSPDVPKCPNELIIDFTTCNESILMRLRQSGSEMRVCVCVCFLAGILFTIISGN